MLVENHRLLREGLKKSIELDPGLAVVAEADDGFAVIEYLADHWVDVVLMDINLKQLSGIDTTRLLAASHPEIKVIAMSMHKDINYLRAMLEAGAFGYVLKSCSGKIVSQAVASVLKGEKYFCQEMWEFVQEYNLETGAVPLDKEKE